MTRLQMSQQGIAHIILVLGVVLVVVGFAGYEIVQKSNKMNSPSAFSTTSTQATVPTKIQSKADVRQAAQALANEPIGRQLNPNQLNSDLNSLL